ncbi:MAG: hypothetical protein E7508_10810 [Ruminococcus sp.]|nr:hypothetical protein [Ruminococcus sp.]
MEITLFDVLTAIETVQEVVDVINENTNDGLPAEFTDGEANTDLEVYLSDISNALMYDEENTALYEISSRLEVIDTRLDTEFLVLNECFGLISTVLLTFLSIKFFEWVSNTFSP